MSLADTLRDAWRSIRRQRGFVGLAVTAFALAMALNVTVYAILDALISPRTYIEAPDQLVRPAYYEVPARRDPIDFRAAFAGAPSIAGVSTYGYGGPVHHTASRGKTNRDVTVINVAPDFFALLRTRPVDGRLLDQRDKDVETTPIVISTGLRRSLFDFGEDVIGATITLNRGLAVVVGVVDETSSYPRADIWRISELPERAGFGGLLMRIKTGVSMEKAYADVEVARRRLATERGIALQDTRLELTKAIGKPFRAKGFHFALIGAVLAVLIVAALNIANLQFARSLQRMREMTTRAALGATRLRLVAHVVAETTIIATAGMALGLILSKWGMGLVSATVPPSVAQYVVAPQWSWRVLAASSVGCMIVVLVAGLLPAIRGGRIELGDALRSSPGTGVTRRARFAASALVVGQVSLALTLCIASTLLARTAIAWELFEPGIDTKTLISGFTQLPPSARPERQVVSAERVLASVRSVSGVVNAAAMLGNRQAENRAVVVEGADGSQRQIGLGLNSYYSVVTPTLLATYGVKISQGRDFKEFGETEPAVIVNEAAARAWWPRGDAVGRMIKLGGVNSRAPWVRVVGVHAPMRLTVDPTYEARPSFYYSFAGDTTPGRRETFVSFVARTRRDASATAQDILARFPREVAGPRTNVESFDRSSRIDIERERHAFIATLFAAFAVLALSLAALGVYAVSAHAVAQRHREFGVRLALGASPGGILRGVLREGNLLGMLGIVGGLVVGAWTAGLLRAFLSGMQPLDPVLFASVAAALLAIVVVAALPPALRAAATDPVESLRNV